MSGKRLRFGDCRLDIAARALFRDDRRVDLPPTVFDCIAYLVEHRERAVGRDELVAAVWGRTSISDTMLGKAILAARRAVGDNAAAQAMIRTVPRFGYHWVGEVRDAEAETVSEADVAGAISGSQSAGPTARPGGRRMPTRSTRFIVHALLVIVAAGIGGFAWWHRHVPGGARSAADTPAPGPGNPVAVLPFDVVAGADDAWLRLGLMDLLANRLRSSGLPVMSSDAVVTLLKHHPVENDRGARALFPARSTCYLIRPSVVKAGGGWMVHVELQNGDATRGTFSVRDSAPVAATRKAADRILDLLGQPHPASAEPSPAELSLTDLLQRTEAALLADDIDRAQSLVAAAPAAMQALPEVRLRNAAILIRAGRFDAARTQLQRLLPDVSAEDDPDLRARALATLCNVWGRLDQAQHAIDSCTGAITLVQERQAPETLAIAYNNRGITFSRLRDYDKADTDFARARIAFGRTGDMLAMARLDGNTASMAMARGRYAEALPILESAERTFERFGLLNESLIAITNGTEANLALLQPAAALATSERGWSIFEHVHDDNLQHHFKRERALALAANGRLAEAHALLDQLLHDIDAKRESALLGLVKASQARLELEHGQAGVAAVLAQQATALLPVPEYGPARAEATLTKIRALRTLGRGPEAADASARLTQWAASADSPPVTVAARLAAAGESVQEQRSDDADRQYRAALAAAVDERVPAQVAEVAVEYGRWLIGRGKLERATVVAGKLVHHADDDFDCALLEAQLYQALGQSDTAQAAFAHARSLAGERAVPAVDAAGTRIP
jgi:DNA-binding winged helix-turn-helix (wHTH) protein/Tfp pilus assembly protein PilF